MSLAFSEDEIRRYSRNMLLAEIGAAGQARLRDAGVLVAGAGGLGSPALLYLAAAGVGRIGIVDHDRVELSNLQRQIAHDTARIGAAKAESAAAALRALNPEIAIEAHLVRLGPDNAAALLARYDLACDCTDNFQSRFLLADACAAARRPLVSAAVLGFEGQLATFKPYAGPDQPCYRCLHPAPPPGDPAEDCNRAGILGAVAGVMGAMQALESVKELLGIGESLAGRLLLWNALPGRFRTIALPRDPGCPGCGRSRHEHGKE